MRSSYRSLVGFNGHPPLGVNATIPHGFEPTGEKTSPFQWAPTLGGECYAHKSASNTTQSPKSFNGHPPLGVNATVQIRQTKTKLTIKFQWAPTLGGECYTPVDAANFPRTGEFQWAPTLGGECYELLSAVRTVIRDAFQWAPTLGGECYDLGVPNNKEGFPSGFNGHPPLGVNATAVRYCSRDREQAGFNGHPPLGVNATLDPSTVTSGNAKFQWAPTLGGECYGIVYLITPPLCQEVNALLNISQRF